MKKKLCLIFLAIVCAIAILPISAFAQTYTMSGTDMHISLDDTVWYVFTRDNILNNPELDEFGLTSAQMQEVFDENEAYMDAVLVYDDGDFVELFVRKRALDADVVNLTNYSHSDVMDLAEELAEIHDTQQYTVYENQFKYARLEYEDSGYYICEYVTVVNADNYTLTFQSYTPFEEWEYEEITNIVDSVRFDVDPTMKEPKNDSGSIVLERTLIGAGVGALSGALGAIARKKKKKKSEENNPVENF